jgi:hypothetical protein
MPLWLVTEEYAAIWTGRPPSTIRRWAAEGRITRYGHGRGNIRFDLSELPSKYEDKDGNVQPGPTPEKRSLAAAA